MGLRSAQATEERGGPSARRRGRFRRATRATRVPPDATAHLTPSALTFAECCHAGQRRQSDGAAFVEHPLEVAGLLRDAGCSDVVVAAGLLHDVLEHTDVGLTELRSRFGADVADLVKAVTDDGCLASYRPRKQLLCEQVRNAGADAALLFAADKISKVRELADPFSHDRAPLGATPFPPRARNHLESYRRMLLEHYRESLAMLQRVVPRHPLVKQLASELDGGRLARVL